MTSSHTNLNTLLNNCIQYKERSIGIDELKNGVWKTVQTLTNIDQKDLRNFLLNAEAHLDMIQFTSENMYKDSLGIVSEIVNKIDAESDDVRQISINMDKGKIQIWIEPKTGFFMKTVVESDDSVRMTGDKARELAKILSMMADKADKVFGINNRE